MGSAPLSWCCSTLRLAFSRVSGPERPLWGGRIEGGLADEMVPLNDSLGVDFRLWRHDVRGSQAWARELGRAEVIPQNEAEALVASSLWPADQWT
jgi:hypothetical protein